MNITLSSSSATSVYASSSGVMYVTGLSLPPRSVSGCVLCHQLVDGLVLSCQVVAMDVVFI